MKTLIAAALIGFAALFGTAVSPRRQRSLWPEDEGVWGNSLLTRSSPG
jgi:hypothetical protein